MAEYDSPLGLHVKVLDKLAPDPMSGDCDTELFHEETGDCDDESMGILPNPLPSSPVSVADSSADLRARAADPMDACGGSEGRSAPPGSSPGSPGLRIRVRHPPGGCPRL